MSKVAVLKIKVPDNFQPGQCSMCRFRHFCEFGVKMLGEFDGKCPLEILEDKDNKNS